MNEQPSKSERKRQSLDLQTLGEALISLPETELQALPLPETLRDAVMLARRITAHGGLYRQKQYIGKLMRKMDAEPIKAAMEARANQLRIATLRLRTVETWRNRLITQGEPALAALLAEHPDADHASLLKLLNQARSEHERGTPPQASRALFTVLRDLLG